MIDGKVISTGFSNSYGNFIHIEIANEIILSYNHLNKVLVKQNEILKSGDLIGLGGSTGNSTAPHLHLSLIKNKEPIDPLFLVNYPFTENFALEFSQRGVPFIYGKN